MKHPRPLTPKALYAKANGYSVAGEYADEAESRRAIWQVVKRAQR